MKVCSSFQDFYPSYLAEHTDSRNRLLHFLAGWLVLAVCTASVFAGAWTLIYTPIVGYAPAWVGHFFFEKNKPATFRHPIFSFVAFWVMFWEMLVGRFRPVG